MSFICNHITTIKGGSFLRNFYNNLRKRKILFKNIVSYCILASNDGYSYIKNWKEVFTGILFQPPYTDSVELIILINQIFGP